MFMNMNIMMLVSMFGNVLQSVDNALEQKIKEENNALDLATAQDLTRQVNVMLFDNMLQGIQVAPELADHLYKVTYECDYSDDIIVIKPSIVTHKLSQRINVALAGYLIKRLDVPVNA